MCYQKQMLQEQCSALIPLAMCPLLYAALLEPMILWIVNMLLLPSLLAISPISAPFTAAIECPAVFYFLHVCSSVELHYDDYCFYVPGLAFSQGPCLWWLCFYHWCSAVLRGRLMKETEAMSYGLQEVSGMLMVQLLLSTVLPGVWSIRIPLEVHI